MTKRLLINGFIFNPICDVVAMELCLMNTDMIVSSILKSQDLFFSRSLVQILHPLSEQLQL